MEFPHHQLCKIDKLILVRAVTVEAVSFGVVLIRINKRESQSFDTEYDVFHRIIWKRFFCVLDMRIDDHQIVRFHRNLIVFNIESTLSTQNVEKLWKLVCVREWLPVALVLGDGNVAKLEVFAGVAAGIQINKFITHKESPLNYYNFILFSELFIFYTKYIKKQYF